MKNWFDHDYSARNDERVLEIRAEYGAEGYGLYWMLLESLAENDGYLNKTRMGGLSLSYGVVKATLEGVLNLCLEVGLFSINDNGVFWSERMLQHVNKVTALSEAGKKGANIREENRRNKQTGSHAQATLKPPLSHPSTEENRIEENRRENTHTHTAHERPKIEKVIEHGNMRGILPEVCTDYFNKRERDGWQVMNGGQLIPIQNWRADFDYIAPKMKVDSESKRNRSPAPSFGQRVNVNMEKITEQVNRVLAMPDPFSTPKNEEEILF